jgi:D-alanyl-D-alanine carboxypeptidase (penicillin-binding protein 5/6)
VCRVFPGVSDYDPEGIIMASRRTSRSTGAGTTKAAARWRRATAGAAGVLVAAALIGPAGANASWSDYDADTGNTTPAGQGSASDAGGYDGVLPPVTASAAIVVDRHTGEVLGAKNPNVRWAPASTTKMMTGLLASEAIAAGDMSLSDTVTIPADVDMELGDGDGAGLSGGDAISLQDLLYMAMLDSDGDAATAIAMYVGGYPSQSSSHARDVFIERMNERAAELGLDNTSFVDVSGRDPEDLGSEGVDGYEECTGGNQFDVAACAHYSTARDLAALARVVLDDPLLATIVSTKTWTTTTWRSSCCPGVRPFTARNTNRLLRPLPGEAAYAGAYGVKTGTSHMAGENLVSAAKNATKPPTAPSDEASMSTAGQAAPSALHLGSVQSGQTSPSDVIAVVLGSDDDDSTTADRFTDSRALLDFGLQRAP